MRSLELPADILSGVAALEAVCPPDLLNARRRALIQGLFDNYRAQGGRRDLVTPSKVCNRGAIKTALTAAYDQTYEGKALHDLRLRLKALATNRCPSCGGSRPGELDHHLAKTTYAEFSVFPLNLVAMCNECNKRKSTRTARRPEEAFLHPYLDVVPPVPFLKFAVEIQDKAIWAIVSFDDGAQIGDAVLKARMKNQLDKIRVNERIASEITEFLSEKADNIVDAYGDPPLDVVRAYLGRAAASAAETYSAGSWQAALLAALAKNDAYCGGGYRIPRQVRLQRAAQAQAVAAG